MPGGELRPIVDEGQIERAGIDLDRQLEGRDQDPIERHQRHEGPEEESRIGGDLGDEGLRADVARLEQALAQRASVGSGHWYFRDFWTT